MARLPGLEFCSGRVFACCRHPLAAIPLYNSHSPHPNLPFFCPESIPGSSKLRQIRPFRRHASRQLRMRHRENVRKPDIDQNHDNHHPHDKHSDRGCSVETSINHRPRALHVAGEGPRRQSHRFENMLCRRIATSDPAKVRPRKLLRWAGKSHFLEIKSNCTVADTLVQ